MEGKALDSSFHESLEREEARAAERKAAEAEALTETQEGDGTLLDWGNGPQPGKDAPGRVPSVKGKSRRTLPRDE